VGQDIKQAFPVAVRGGPDRLVLRTQQASPA